MDNSEKPGLIVPDWKHLFQRHLIGTVPQGEVVLTARVDVQKDRIEVELEQK